jgi:hypothetical protein
LVLKCTCRAIAYTLPNVHLRVVELVGVWQYFSQEKAIVDAGQAIVEPVLPTVLTMSSSILFSPTLGGSLKRLREKIVNLKENKIRKLSRQARGR